jgi:putative ABC transport system substrate-binding protein
LIAAVGGSELAAKSATAAIPIVFTTGGDPVELGLVTSLNKPGGNITGVTFLASDLGAGEVRDVEAAARSLGMQINVLNASTSYALDAAFATFGRERPDALFVGGDPFLLGQRKRTR